MLSSPHNQLCVPVDDLLLFAGGNHLLGFVKQKYEAIKPRLFQVVLGFPMGAGAVAGHLGKSALYGHKVRQTLKLIRCFDVVRSVLTLTEKEKAAFRAIAALTAAYQYTPEQWTRFLAQMTWNGGRSILEETPPLDQHQRNHEIRAYLAEYLKTILPDHDSFVAEVAQYAAHHHLKETVTSPAIGQATADGTRWMNESDFKSSPFYKIAKSPLSLQLGIDPATGKEIFFDGHESLITIGGPGSGKSQAHVITNLLRSPGSAIVLDVKGELWEKTAGYREKRWGPVYRFSPTDAAGSACYNPFDFISTKPDEAADDCGVFSYQVIADNPKLHDPFWENRGRDFIWAYAMVVALTYKPADRTIESLYKLLSLPLDPDSDSEISKFADLMSELGQKHNIPDLDGAANALIGGMAIGGKTIEGVLDTGRRYLAGFARSAHTRRAMSKSDWTPQDLRSRQGSTLYICLSPTELKSFAPIVRLILAQHSRILQRHLARKDEVPITFFLDEMPQLGNFEAILELQDVGRGAGLRLWMFAQTLGQLSKAFGHERYKGVVDACRVRCFMQPDNEAAQLIAPALGEVRNFFNGERRPLATANDLMGRAYHDKTIITTRGDHPMALDKVMAWKSLANRMFPTPHRKGA